MTQQTLKRLLAAGLLLPMGFFAQCRVNAAEPAPAADAQKSSQPAAQKKETAVSPAQTTCMEYSVPCLTVWGDGSHGKLSYLPLKFTRTKENKPLRIMIIDDTPHGSGKTIHSSVWLAAVTAAMLRNDTMHGTTISVEFTGNVDGPSAGAVTCLAILSALDGIPLPNDFAMTGTILPDGTIGVVGGVPEKIRAAAKAGKKRIFIPAFLRFEENAKGEKIDLQRVADELNVKLYRVENISEAYAALHGKPYTNNEYINVRDMTRLPRATEDVLIATYKKYLDKVKAEIKAHPELEQESILPGYVFSSHPAERLFQEGKLLPATLQIFQTWQAWQASKKTDKFFNDFYKGRNLVWLNTKYLQEYHYQKLIFELRETSQKYIETAAKEATDHNYAFLKKHCGGKEYKGYFPFKPGQSEFSAQLEPVETQARLRGLLQMLFARCADEKTIHSADIKGLKNEKELEHKLLNIFHLAILPLEEYHDFLAELAGTLPNKKANKRAAEVERLFYSATHAAGFVAVDNLKSSTAAAGKKNAEDEIRNNPYFLPFLEMQAHAWETHQQLEHGTENKASFPDYHLQASLKAQVTTFTMASALLITYGPDKFNDFIPHMLRNARNSAIRNINECVNANIPCVSAICDFEMAESASGSDMDDKAVLMAYWRASLYAKALLMSFK